MSRNTSAEEINVTCGFFNSNSDQPRRYDATDFGKLFDGMVTDGVFMSIGDQLRVTASTGNTVVIGTGKCWFNHTWTLNSEPLSITCDPADSQLSRIDAIALEVNSTQSVRDNSFKYIKGTPASKPARPTWTDSDLVHTHALCYITRPAGSDKITQANITNVVGTSETPFITALLQTISIDELLGQWEAQLDEFVAQQRLEVVTNIEENELEYSASMTAKEQEFDKLIADKNEEYSSWYGLMQHEMESLLGEVRSWYTNTDATIDAYLDSIKTKLSTDVAVSLQMQIDESEIKNVLMNGFTNGTKQFSEDGSVVTSSDSLGRILVKTFTNSFLTSTTVLKTSNGTELGRLVKNISSDGLTITSEITLL